MTFLLPPRSTINSHLRFANGPKLLRPNANTASDHQEPCTAELRRKGVTLFPARRTTSLDSCSIQCLPVERVWMQGISNGDTHWAICTRRTTTHLVHLRTSKAVRRSVSNTDGMRSDWKTIQYSVFSSPTSVPTLLEWRPCQEQRGWGLTAFAPVSDVSVSAYTNRAWPLMRLVSVAQRNRPLTMLSFPVQSIDLHMERMTWRCWMTRQWNGLPRALMRPINGLQEHAQTMQKKYSFWSFSC